MRHSMTGNTMERHEWGQASSRWRPMLVALLLPLTVLGWASVRPTLRLPVPSYLIRDAMLGPVVTVAAVAHGLARDPAGWSGRVVLVRGQAVRYVTWRAPDSLVTQLALVDPGNGPGTSPLSLAWGRPDPSLAAWRRLPLLGRVAPPAQRPYWDRPAVYRLQLCAPAACSPGSGDAVLLDADPGSR